MQSQLERPQFMLGGNLICLTSYEVHLVVYTVQVVFYIALQLNMRWQEIFHHTNASIYAHIVW
jgi:hypothetical protein